MEAGSPPPPRGRLAFSPSGKGNARVSSGSRIGRSLSRAGRWRSESRTVRGSVDESPVSSSSAKDVEKAEKGSSAATLTREERILSKLPHVVGHFLGYRRPSSRSPLQPLVKLLGPTLETWIWAWIGAFVSLGCIAIVFTRCSPFTTSLDVPEGAWTAPVIIGSFGASSVLLFGTPAVPLAQPWAFFCGQVISAFVGVAVTKLFRLNGDYNLMLTDRSESLVWVAGAVATATSLLFMFLTNSVHPPGGATALLAATSPPVEHLGWRYIVVVMMSSGMMLLWAMIWMNLGSKRYPQKWYPGPGTHTGFSAIGDLWSAYEKRREARTKKHDEPAADVPPDGWLDETDWQRPNPDEPQERPTRWARS